MRSKNLKSVEICICYCLHIVYKKQYEMQLRLAKGIKGYALEILCMQIN